MQQYGLDKYISKKTADTLTVGLKKTKKGDSKETGTKPKKAKSAEEETQSKLASQDAARPSEESKAYNRPPASTPASNGQGHDYTYERVVSDNQQLIAGTEALKRDDAKDMYDSASAVATSRICNDDRLNELAKQYNLLVASFAAQKEEYEKVIVSNQQLVAENEKLRDTSEDDVPLSALVSLQKYQAENKALKEELAKRIATSDLSMKYDKMAEENRRLKEELDNLRQRQAER